MIKFVVYGANRSGSHYLQTLLNSHPAINCYWDIFWSGGTTPYCMNAYLTSHGRDRIPRFLGRKKIIFDFLDDHYAKSSGMGAAGFLLKWGTASRYPEILAWLKRNNAKIVHIVRENFLMHLVAFELRRKGIVTSHSRTEIEFSKVKLDADKLLIQLRAAKKALESERLKLRRYQFHEVKYERLLSHEVEEASRILKFLEVESATNLVSEFRKTESESPSEMIENYAEIHDLLSGSEFSIYLENK